MPVTNYPGVSISKSQAVKDQQVITIPNVINSFDNIPLTGDYIPISSHQILIKSNSYNPYLAKNVLDFGNDAERRRHFQGLVRTNDGKYIIIAGGDHLKKTAQLFVCKVESKQKQIKHEIGIGATISNKKHGALVDIFVADKGRYWHNGGISVYGDILVLPLESDGFLPKQKFTTEDSIIRFLDISNPAKPKDLKIDIKRPGTKSGSASLIRLPNQKYLCAVWTDSDPNGKRRVDFYLSESTYLKDGFQKSPASYMYSEAFNTKAKYQSIQLVVQKDKSRKYKVFMIGTQNSYSWSPIPPSFGDNRARLYEIKFNQSIEDSNFVVTNPTFVMRRGTKDKVFKGGGKRYNFNAAAGVYITPDHGLALYASHHRTYHFGQIISLTEFYPVFKKKKIANKDDSLIELYQHKNFKGSCLRLRGYNETTLNDYTKVKAEDLIFNNKISSIRFQIPKGKQYNLFEFTDFKGKQLELYGSGAMIEVKNIHLKRKKITSDFVIPANMGDVISSSKYI